MRSGRLWNRLTDLVHGGWRPLRGRPDGEDGERLRGGRETRTREPEAKAPGLSSAGLSVIGGPRPGAGDQHCYVFSTVRDERLRLPYFLRFYRKMGARSFVVADNQSRDGTTQYLREQPDVLLCEAPGSYAESRYGTDWLNALLDAFGRDRWCLTVDADELLVFPHCERLRLPGLIQYLESVGANALPAFLLDMYSKEPIRDAVYRAETPFLSVCPFFDGGGYREQPGRRAVRGLPSRGGARSRLFWQGRGRKGAPPFLRKIPLVRWSRRTRYRLSTHQLAGERLADVTGALLHFKFFADFPIRVEQEAERREHFDGASQYAAYWDVIREQPDLSAFHEGSVLYEDSLQLVRMGLIATSPAIDSMARSAGDAGLDSDGEV